MGRLVQGLVCVGTNSPPYLSQCRLYERTVCILTLLSYTDSGVGKLTLTMTKTMARLTSVMAFVPLFFGISYSISLPKAKRHPAHIRPTVENTDL